jgi:hypothetical protein
LSWVKNEIRYVAANGRGIPDLNDVPLALGNKKTGTGAGKWNNVGI